VAPALSAVRLRKGWGTGLSGRLEQSDRIVRMIRQFEMLIVIGLLMLAAAAKSQSSPLHKEIIETYSFQPHLLDKEKIAERSAVLDRFWDKAKAQRSVYIAGLRAELAEFSNPPFFLYDGSMLLLSLSDTHEDHTIALTAIAHCDLRDVRREDYFWNVHRLASLGEDTTAAAFHVLDDPSFTVIVPEHALTLGQDFVLVYLLLPTEDRFWLQPAISRLKLEKDQTAQKSLIRLLWYAQDNSADRAIAAFASDSSKPEATRKIASEASQKPKLGAKALAEIASLGSTEESLRAKRRKRMQAVSDEALGDLDEYTLAIASKRK